MQDQSTLDGCCVGNPLKIISSHLPVIKARVIPAWTDFNIKLRQEDVPRESSIGYCQVIDASPTEIPTVYTLLQRSLLMADQLGQQNVIIVFDQAIYAKALEVIWQNQVTFQRLVVRMGSFHTICSFLAATHVLETS